jgi:hypothetical protein
LDAIKGIGGEGGNAILNQKEDQNKDLEAIFDAVKQTPQADTNSIVSTLRERLPEVVREWSSAVLPRPVPRSCR